MRSGKFDHLPQWFSMSDHRQSCGKLQEKPKFLGPTLPYSNSAGLGKGLSICILKVFLNDCYALVWDLPSYIVHRIHKVSQFFRKCTEFPRWKGEINVFWQFSQGGCSITKCILNNIFRVNSGTSFMETFHPKKSSLQDGNTSWRHAAKHNSVTVFLQSG